MMLLDRTIFDEIRGKAVGKSSPGPDLVVELRCEAADPPVTWQVYRENRLDAWTTEPPGASAELVLEFPSDQVAAMFGLMRNDTGVVDIVGMKAGVPGGPLLPLPPFDVPDVGWRAVPYANAEVDILMLSGPSGHYHIRQSYVEGLPQPAPPGEREPDVKITANYATLVAHRAGTASIFEVIAGADATGQQELISLVVGLLADHAHRPAEDRGDVVDALGKYCAHVADAEHQVRISRRARRTVEKYLEETR